MQRAHQVYLSAAELDASYTATRRSLLFVAEKEVEGHDQRLETNPIGKKYANLPKNAFPAQLKEMREVLNTDNLISGFKTCRLYPLDNTPVLAKLPKKHSGIGNATL